MPWRCRRRSTRAIAAHPRVTVERIPNGTNLARRDVQGRRPRPLVARAAGRARHRACPARVAAPATVTLGVNETWNAHDGARSWSRAFEQALGVTLVP